MVAGVVRWKVRTAPVAVLISIVNSLLMVRVRT